MPAKIDYESDKEYHQQVSHDYYHNDKEHVLRYMKNKYDNLSKEQKDTWAFYVKNWDNNLTDDKKNIKREYARNRYRSLPDDRMLKLNKYQKEYQKNIEK